MKKNEIGMEERVIILNLTPQTNVRATQGDKVFFRIPEADLRPPGLKRKRRLERYNNYKIAIKAEAAIKGFNFPTKGTSVKFYIPMPKSWSKKKRKAMHGMVHNSTPDMDNFLKALGDGLLIQDKHIGHLSELGKYWVDFPIGWIEIVERQYVEPDIDIPKCVLERVDRLY
jgi:Holliday junction resolvase RusA-like endonuclease